MAELRQLAVDGPDLTTDKVVRWRIADLHGVVKRRFSVDVQHHGKGQKTPDLRAVLAFSLHCPKLAAGAVGSGDRQCLAHPVPSILQIAVMGESKFEISEEGNPPESRR